MHAFVVDHSGPSHLAQVSVPAPAPAAHQAVVQVLAASINPGDLAQLADAPTGHVPGWEAAGVVVRAAADGSGPAEGTRVATLAASGAWAHERVVDTDLIGVVPDAVDLAEAAVLPVAATSALRALRCLGSLLGRRVLVTGASGAVGRFAVQLAAAGGAEVVAGVRSAAAADDLRGVGAAEVVDGDLGRLDLVAGVIDTVGGPSLVDAFDRLAAGGTLVSVGRASGEESVFTPGALLGDFGRHGRTVSTFFLADGTPGLGADISWLAGRLGDGLLDIGPTVRLEWPAVGDQHQLWRSGSAGKVVLTRTT